ncbi:MAG: HAMP domain-containing histidine kinase [Chitinophagales bacterium]|nr:HAMP domain-containing histidine kinase [Chitinophagales bacterium]
MNRAALRTLVVLAVLSVICIIALQLFWIKKSLNLKDDQFNHRVHVALNSVANKLIANSKTPIGLDELNRTGANYYTLDFSDKVTVKHLEEYLITEFRNQDLQDPFEYALYDCNTDSLLFGKFIPKLDIQKIEQISLRQPTKDNFYIGIFFPNKKPYLRDDWNIIALSSVILVIILFFFGFSILTILNQKKIETIKNDFINNMTHEFKTPIASIGMASEVLMRENISEFPQKINHYASIINEENNRLKSQVELILRTAQIDSKNIKLTIEAFDIHDVIIQNVKNVFVRIHEIGGKISTQLEAVDSIINGDKVHITNILFNLLDNAIKYCDKTPEIMISTKNKGHQIQIAIQDNGKGISTEDSEQIFNKFYRVSSGDRHDIKGFGIGLFYVRNMLKLHRGSISLKSKLGHGTTFFITLPLKE